MEMLFLCARYAKKHPSQCSDLTLGMIAEWGALYAYEVEMQGNNPLPVTVTNF